MEIRTFEASDLPAVLDLTIATFRPFFEDYVHPLLGDEVFAHQHGSWQQDYRDDVPLRHDPAAGRHAAVAVVDGEVVGWLSWEVGPKPQHGQIYLLAVAASQRRQQLGRELCLHAIAAMRADGVHVVGIGTGDDAFHAAARSLYEGLGFTKIPIAGYLKRI
jgi:ribosomal protein S18 acetylase RimI-like enzyme